MSRPIVDGGAGVRLTRSNVKLTTASMRRFLRRADISGAQYRMWTGGQGFSEFIIANPSWSLRDWELLVLENLPVMRGESWQDT